MFICSLICLVLVDSIWKTEVIGCPMFILKKKLKLLKCKINDWNKIIFGNIHKNVRKAKICLQEVQNNIVAQSHSDYLIEKENHAQVILDNALFIVDLFWKEKARVRWYAKGDWNTKYFHMIAKIKNAARGIHSIKIDDTLTIDPNKIATHVVNHYYDSFNIFPIL